MTNNNQQSFLHFLSLWLASGGAESRVKDLLPLAEAAGIDFGRAEKPHARVTRLGELLSAARSQAIEVGGQWVAIRARNCLGPRYRLERVSTGD